MEKSNIFAGVIVILIIGVIICLLPWIGAYSSVDAGNIGIITRFGAVNRVVNPGLVLKIPLVESVLSMETRTQKEQVDASAASEDLQEVKSSIALNFHLDGTKALDVYQNIGTEYIDRIIAPAMQEAFKATTAKFTAEKLIENRESVKQSALSDLKERLSKYNIIVDDFNIVNFDFSADFSNAIEQKQVSQQNLEKAKIDAETALTTAQGQSNAQKALKDSESLSPEYLQFFALQKWNGVLPNATNGVPFINIPTK